MIKLLFVGDFIATTGFEKVNRSLLTRFPEAEWDIAILAINATGDAHPLQRRFKIYPAGGGGRDAFGIERFAGMVNHVRPDVIVIHQDSWNASSYLEAYRDWLSRGDRSLILPPTIVYCPPDAPNQHQAWKLNGDTSLLLCPTQFGVHEITKGGYRGPTAVLPYGVDQSVYFPVDQAEARASLGLPADAFIVGRADRNAKRKRYDLMLRYWARWWAEAGRPDHALLYLHCAPIDVGWDLPQLATYYGIAGQVVFTAKDLTPGALGPEERLRRIYNSWDVHASTTVGEGWGLVAHESAACAVPQILPDWSAFGEWMKDGATLVPVTSHQVHEHGVNTIGGVPDEEGFVRSLSAFWTMSTADRAKQRSKALLVARKPEYEWDRLAHQLQAHCREVILRRVPYEE